MFMKTFKKSISLLVVFVFIMSLIPAVGMAEVTLPGYKATAAAKPWIGTNVPSANMIGFDASGSVVSALSGTTSSNLTGKTAYQSELQYSYGTFGKKAEDAVYIVRDRDTRTSEDLSQFGSFINMGTPGTDYCTDFAVEFSFVMTDANDKIGILTPMYADKSKAGGTSGTTGIYVDILKDKVQFVNVNGSKNSVTKTFEKELELNKWYNAIVVYDINNDTTTATTQSVYNWRVYINNELYADAEATATWYGPRYVRFGTHNVGNSFGTVPDNFIHYDNIDSYAIPSDGSFGPNNPTCATLASTNSNVKITNNRIEIPDTATVADVKSAVNASLRTGDVIRFYNADYSKELVDTDSPIGANAVVASSKDYTVNEETVSLENTFSYYTVSRGLAYRFENVFDGGTILPKSGGSENYLNISVEANGLGGKNAAASTADKYYKFTDFSGNPYITFGASDYCAGKNDVAEFSFFFNEGDDNFFKVEAAIFCDTSYDDKGYKTEYCSFDISENGIKGAQSSTVTARLKDVKIPVGEWVNMAIVAPKCELADSDKDYELYMNGELILQFELPFYSTDGFRHVRFFGGTESEDVPSAYLDNVKVYSGEYYPAYDKKATVSMTQSGIDLIGKTITVADSATTVADIINDLTVTKYSNIRIYDENDVLVTSDAQVVEDGYTVVIAATNDTNMERAYSYFEIRVVDGECAFDVPAITVSGDAATGTVKVYNYTDDDVKYIVYLAVYADGQLVSLNPTTVTTAPAGETTTTTIPENFASGNTAKLMVWEENGITPKLVATVK